MSERDDPLDGLHEAWEELGGDQAEGLPEPDEVDRELLRWMRQAWVSIDVPEAVVPTPHRSWPTRIGAGLALAAGVLLIIFVQGGGVEPSPELPQAPGPAQVVDFPSEVVALPTPTLRDDGWELRSGPVKLVMVRPVIEAEDKDLPR